MTRGGAVALRRGDMSVTCHSLLILAVLATIAAPGAADASFTFTAADRGAVTDLAVVSTFTTTVRNTGVSADTYTVTVYKDLPGAWMCSLCEGTVCYPPFVEQITFNLGPGGETNVDVDLTPLEQHGSGSVQVSVTAGSEPLVALGLYFGVVTTGVDVLLVDADWVCPCDEYFTPALEASTLSWARWMRGGANTLSGLELGHFTAVIWFADAASPALVPALDDSDRAALSYYVQHGGSLLLCGQGVIKEACDFGSPWFSPQASAWFATVLGVLWQGPASAAAAVATLPAAPFAPSRAALLAGEGGAGNSTKPDALGATGAGTVAQIYANGAGAGVASTWGAGRSFFCGYALEAMSPAIRRDEFLTGFLDWARGLPTGVGEDLPSAGPLAPSAAPNPFNPVTRVSVTVASPGPVRVGFYDVRGHLVRRLDTFAAVAGPVSVVWDGRDQSGRPAPSGSYVARVVARGASGAVKLTLAK